MTNRAPVYDINDYILNATPVGAMLGWPTTGLFRPIIPVQQQPEMNEENPLHPYVVYTYRNAPEGQDWWVMTEETTYVIWGRSLDTLTEITNELTDIFKRLDESAQEVNDWLRRRIIIDAQGNTIPVPREFEFFWFRVVSTFSPEATSQEGGRYGKPITLRYQYVPLAGRSIK